MMRNGLQDFTTYWQTVFSSEDPIREMGLNDLNSNLSQFQTDVAPEPYYGYFNEDMTNDVLLLLLNPGEKGEQTNESGWNERVRDRYAKLWSKDLYHRQEESLKGINRWCDKRLNQARGIVGDVGFLHTMEFFPFHSKKDELSESFKRRWVNEFEMADLAFYALKDIAVNHMVKHIFSVSNDWIRILEKHHVPLTKEVILKKRGGKDYSFHFKVYQVDEEALPILFCDLKGSPMNLPKNEFAVQVARYLLGHESSIPVEHSVFEIQYIEHQQQKAAKSTDIVEVVDGAIKKVWLEKISKDYQKLYLLKEDSLKNALYYHLRTELGDAFLDKHHLRIFTEFYQGGERIDIVVAQMDPTMGNRDHLQEDVVRVVAAIEIKYKNGPSDLPFQNDVKKVLQYIRKDADNNGQYYLAFIQEATYMDIFEEFFWVSEPEQENTQGRLTEMTGLFLPESQSLVWRVHSYNQMNQKMNKTVK